MKEVIIGATTALCVFGAFFAFGACLVVAAQRFIEEWSRERGERGERREED